MELVETLDEIIENTKTIDTYLDEPTSKEFAKGLVKRGLCFVVINKNSKLRFYPSRFVGYKNNTCDEHICNDEKDGRKTNPAISKIIGHRLEYEEDLEAEYICYCETLGFTVQKRKRKYWETVQSFV